jgi:DNA-binding CsgD family transcriptional regulator
MRSYGASMPNQNTGPDPKIVQRNNAIIQAYDGGKSSTEIAKDFGMHVQTVRTALGEARKKGLLHNNKHESKRRQYELDIAARNDKILDFWQAGRDSQAIAGMFKITEDSLKGIIKRAREKKDPRAVLRGGSRFRFKSDRIVELWDEGKTARQIATELGCHHGSVRKAIKRAQRRKEVQREIKPRPASLLAPQDIEAARKRDRERGLREANIRHLQDLIRGGYLTPEIAKNLRRMVA